jgi:hypothetical protein
MGDISYGLEGNGSREKTAHRRRWMGFDSEREDGAPADLPSRINHELAATIVVANEDSILTHVSCRK